MNKINKYKNILFLNYDGFLEYESNKNKINYPINYIFNRKFNIIRNFLYFYSVFLSLIPFSSYQHKNNQEFRINLNSVSSLILDENYESFFLIYLE